MLWLGSGYRRTNFCAGRRKEETVLEVTSLTKEGTELWASSLAKAVAL